MFLYRPLESNKEIYMKKRLKVGIICCIIGQMIASALPVLAINSDDVFNAYDGRTLSAVDWDTLRTSWVINGSTISAEGTTNSYSAVFKGINLKSYDFYFDLNAVLKDGKNSGYLRINISDINNPKTGSKTNVKLPVTETDISKMTKGTARNVLVSVSGNDVKLSAKWADEEEYTEVESITLTDMAEKNKCMILDPKDIYPTISNVKGYSKAEVLGENIPSDNTYSLVTVEEFDGESGIRWEKLNDYLESGFKQKEGKLVQNADHAAAAMRKYFAGDYMMEFAADLSNKITLAAYDSTEACLDKFAFDPLTGDFYHDDVLVKSGNSFSFEPGTGKYLIEIAASDTRVQIFIKKDSAKAYDYVGAFTCKTASAIRPVIISEEKPNEIEYIKIGNKADADLTKAEELNQIIAEENSILEAKEEALAAVTGAASVADMETAIKLPIFELKNAEFFAVMDDEETKCAYTTALAEMMLNDINDIKQSEKIDSFGLEQFEKCIDDNIDILKLSYLAGDEFIAQLEAMKYDGIDLSDEDYAANKEKIAAFFKELNTDIIKSKNGVVEGFNNAQGLYMLNNVQSRDEVGSIIIKYKEILDLDLQEYNSSNKSEVNSALLNKNFMSKAEVQNAIDEKIEAIKATPVETPTRSSGGSSGHSSSGTPLNTIPTVKPTSTPTAAPVETKTCNFEDLETVAWAKESIISLYDKGIINGVTDTEFEPQRNVTRAEFVKIVVEALNIKSDKTVEFKDVDKKAWYANAINAASANGIVNGKGDGYFYPNESMTRQDAAVVLYKAASNLNKKSSVELTDIDDVSGYAKESVIALIEANIISGYDDKKFAPKNNITRAQAAIMIDRLLKNN